MRRRRNADAPSNDETTNVNVTDSATENENASASAPEPTDASIPTPPKTTRTRKATATSAAAASDPAASPAEGEAAKPRRRTPRAKAAPATDQPAAEAEATSTPTLPEPVADVTEAAPAEKPKRTPRRRAAAKAETVEAVAEEPSATIAASEPEVVAASPTEEPQVLATAAESADTEKKPRRRRSSRRGGASADETAQTPSEPAPAAQTAVPEAVAATGDAEEVAASSGEGSPELQATPDTTEREEDTGTEQRPRRTRGLRRRPTAGAQFVPAPTLAAEIVPATPGTEEATAETTEAPASETPKRTRGLRTRRVPAARAGAAPAPTIVAVAPVVEPVPPPYQPLPQETLAHLAETKIVPHNGIPELVVNDEARLPLWFFVNTEAAEDPEAGIAVAVRQIRLAYEAGIRAFTLLAHLPWKARSGDRRYDPLDSALQLVADNAPDALILPRLIFSPPASWERAHPDEMTRYADGETGDISFASRAFWEGEADDALRAAVEHVAQGPHAGRVFGFYLEHGEWFYEKGRGYDVSPANQTGFRSWLRQKYRNNQIALRAAWHDGSVTFDQAEVPAYPPPTGNTLFFSPREQRWTDFHEYSSDTVAQVILRLGKAVKEASGNRSAVAVSYGYTLELPRASSGHLALGQVLASPYVDILTGPFSYSGRTPGGSATFPAPIDSVTLAGKLWISEDDSKTYLATDTTPDTYNPKIATLDGTRAVQARNFGAALARGTGISWMDLWGEGWLDDREVWQGIAYLRSLADQNSLRRHDPSTGAMPAPDVAVFVDERSFFGVRADEFLLGNLVAHQRDALLRSGARVGFYLLSDLAKKDFPTTPKLFLFLNAYRIPDTVRAAIRDRFQNDGRTFAWLYAPGAQETLGDAVAGDLAEVIGMQLRLQPWASKAGTQVLSSAKSPLTDALRGQKLGEETRFNPTFYAADLKAQPLGEYVSTGNPSIALRKHARWQSVFFGEPAALTVPLLRGLYRLAGVPFYTVDDDAAWLGDNLICLHSAPGGGTTVYLPEEGVLTDLLTGETIASGGWGARLSMPPRGTRLLFYGPASDVVRFGGDPDAAPLGLSREELPAPPVAFAFEAAPALPSTPIAFAPAPAAVDPEDAALFEAALEGEFPFDDVEDRGAAAEAVATLTAESPTVAAPATAEDESAAGRKKRRRRRRGRGKNREAGDTDLAGEGDTDSESDTPSLFESSEEDEEETGVYEGETPGTVIFDVTSETLALAPPGPVQEMRVRPSLEELLPMSDLPDGSELPPIPEEFLPLSDDEFGRTAATGEGALTEEAAEGEESPAPSRRSRRRTSGPRYRRGEARRNTETEEVSPADAPTEPMASTESTVAEFEIAPEPADATASLETSEAEATDTPAEVTESLVANFEPEPADNAEPIEASEAPNTPEGEPESEQGV